MLESASDPAPDGWREALGYGLAVLAELPRAKISVAPGSLGVISVADSEADRDALEARLREAAPEGVRLDLDISAPRPVIAPFAFDLRLADGTARLAACSAESEEAAATILAAARAAGLQDAATCAIGLGAPSPDWIAAVEQGVAALGRLGGGRFALRDLAAELTAPEGTAPERLTAAAGELGAALPAAFRLSATAPTPEAAGPGEPAPAPRFEAVLLLDGNVRLSGPVQDETSRAAIESFAAALFGHDRVIDDSVLDPGLPEGWPVRLLAGIEALAALEEGRAEITESQVRVEGWGLDERVVDEVTALLAAKVGPEAVVDVTFNAEAAAAAALAARPRPEICADQISAILEAGSIRFTPGSADIVPASAGIIAAIADVLRGCPGAEFEIAGHTDAQGPEAANRQLSEERAAAVVAALEAQDLPLVTLVPRGYGASRPVADNDTPDGRSSNRRIEFNLGPVADPDPAASADAAPAADCIPAVDAILAERTLEFEPGAAELTEASAETVTAIGAALAGCPGGVVEIGGHTDAQGSESGNLQLSERRATAVVEALQASAGPDTLPELVARGYGEAEPDRRQRYRGRAGRRTGASPSARLRPRRRRRRKRRRRPPPTAPPSTASPASASSSPRARSSSLPARRRSPTRASRWSPRSARCCAPAPTPPSRSAATPTPKARTRATCGSASAAPRPCSPRCAPTTCRWPACRPAATARPSRSPTTAPPRVGRGTGGSRWRRSRTWRSEATMDRNDLTLAIAGALIAAFLLGWVLRWAFARLNAAGPRNAARTADLAARLHAAEDGQARSERRLAEVEAEASRRVLELQSEVESAREALARAEEQAEEVRAAYRRTIVERS